MHLEIMIEDQSGKEALEILLPQILLDNNVTFNVVSYKGVGHIPRNLDAKHDASKRVLLNNLPRLIRGLGKTFAGYGEEYPAALIIVCDLDDRNLKDFLEELNAVLDECDPKPPTRFCLAIEEGEAWLLGDIPAITSSYPRANLAILNKYVNDSICGTWEVLADALYSGGHTKLKQKGWQSVGAEKSKWARLICPQMDVNRNDSPSFNSFVEDIRNLVEEGKT